jgi:putative colanic acid biosynthesis acetyltransferase WcaB
MQQALNPYPATGFIRYIKQDYAANKGNTTGAIIMILFRTAAYCHGRRYLRILCWPYLFFYKHFTRMFFSLEMPCTINIGQGLRIYHGIGLIVHEQVVIGKSCVLRQSTTIGNARAGGGSPHIGDYVEVGCHVCIIGDVYVGNEVVIGAGSVIIKDVPSGVMVAGNPGRIIKTIKTL